VMAVSLITQGRRGTHAKLLCFDASVQSSNAQAPLNRTVRPPRTMCMDHNLPCKCSAALIQGWRTLCTTVGVPAIKNTRTCTTNAMRVEQASGLQLLVHTWQELPNQEVLVIYRTQRAVCKQPPCLVKESGTSMLITYCHCRLFIHAQSWVTVSIPDLPAAAAL
jgi:hypothetical protein